MGWRLRQVADLGLEEVVRFLGQVPPERLKVALSAADVFVLATRNEGWANVFLEAMACGLPVVTTDVGGNAEVVADDKLGILVPFGDADRLGKALADALTRKWDREAIVAYAENNSWDHRVTTLAEEFVAIVSGRADTSAPNRLRLARRPCTESHAASLAFAPRCLSAAGAPPKRPTFTYLESLEQSQWSAYGARAPADEETHGAAGHRDAA